MGKRRLLAALLAGLLAAQMTACGKDNTCREEECEQEIYRDGYCEDHFYLQQAEELMEGLGY